MKRLSLLLAMISTFVACGMSQRQHYNSYHRQSPRRPIVYQHYNYQRHPVVPVQPNLNRNSVQGPINCIYNGQVLPNPQDVRQYTVCTKLKNSNFWFKNNYNCPSSTVFDKTMTRCMQGMPSTTTTTESSLTMNIAPQAPAASSTEDQSTKNQHASSAHSPTPSIQFQIEIVTDPETSTLQIPTTMVSEVEFSSSSEEFMTHPPHFTRPDGATISQEAPPVHIPWNPTTSTSTQKPGSNVSNSNQIKTTTRLPSVSDADYERLTFLNALEQNKLTNAIPHLSAAQRIPSSTYLNRMRTTSTSTVSPVTDSWPLSKDKEPEISTRFPLRWRPHLNKSSRLES